MQAVKATTDECSQSSDQPRSGCPVSLGLDIFGDRWTLLIVRDLMFAGKRHYREMLHSSEHISTNILADRLKMLLTEGIITRSGDPTHLQKVVYSLTEKGIALYPILIAIGDWSYQYRPVSESYLPAGKVDTEAQMAELRRTHLEFSPP
ncbi:winged helix-turn-helix transcriptional regulator [Deinococcus sp.]|uniref:winged helix-turn-helix transcriptional regulator n=1 Tax=Deinococcus sp. TaxID=47478 RepID=UPI003C7A2F4A